MKRLTNGLKVWIAGSTLVGFLTGWSLLANMGTSAVATTTVAPTSLVTQSTQTTQVSSLDTSTTATSTSTASSASASDNQSQSLQQISAAANVTSNVPRLRTSGS
jgi:hypothetical protein